MLFINTTAHPALTAERRMHTRQVACPPVHSVDARDPDRQMDVALQTFPIVALLHVAVMVIMHFTTSRRLYPRRQPLKDQRTF